MMHRITAGDIDNWTDREPRRAQEVLPLLVWKLILSSCKEIIDHHFPFGDSIQYSGYDGRLETEEDSPFYPTGKSVWEFGTDKGIRVKFNSDYEKRTNNPDGIVLSETTFCFVTSRIWKHKKGIIEATQEKDSEGKWKKVLILDANSLQLWLEQCPAIEIWLSDIIGKPIKDIWDIDGYWKYMSGITSPKLTVDFFTSGRSLVAQQVLSQIEAGAEQIILVADSALEARLSLAAELSTTNDVMLSGFAARCVVVDSQDAFVEQLSQDANAVIIPTFQPSAVQIKANKSITLLFANRYDSLDLVNKTANRIELSARSRHSFCEAIEKLGYDTNEAYAMGQDLRCSFPALFRRITTDAMMKIPKWAQSDAAAKLVPALFAGAWDEKYSGDKEVVSTLAGVPYEDFMTEIGDHLIGENAPIFSVDGFYTCIAISDMWDVLWERITLAHFNRFKECVVAVFSETDPSYELPENERFLASIRGKRMSHSPQLRESLVVSLIMLSQREDATVGSKFSQCVAKECAALVWRIMKSLKTPDQWGTICPQLPTLMEASPDVVLQAIENEVSNPDSPMWGLFKDNNDGLFSRSLYTNVLWALEIALWERTHASRALQLLVCLAEKNIQYKLANTPDSTIYHFLCLWNQQGAFSWEERKILLENIIRDHHNIAPKLISSLLQEGQVTSPIYQPRRRLVEAKASAITVGEYQDRRHFTAETYLTYITPCFEDWSVVFKNIAAFGSTEAIIKKCRSQVPDIHEEDKLKLCKQLAQYISHSRQYQHASKEQVDAVENFYWSILPDSPRSFAHYFSNHFMGLNPSSRKEGHYSYSAEKQRLREFQRAKVREMISRYGEKTLWEIVPEIDDVNAFADAIAQEAMGMGFDWQRLQALREFEPYLAERVMKALCYEAGFSIQEVEKANLKGADLGWVLSCLPLEKEITDYVEKATDEECQRVYWERVRLLGMEFSDKKWVERCVQAALDHKRAYSLIECIAYSEWNDPKLIIEVLCAALQLYPDVEPDGMAFSQIECGCIEHMFQKLYSKRDTLELDIARLELAYLQVFDWEFEPECIVDQVLKHPALYMELLSAAYRSDKEQDDRAAVPTQYIQQAYAVLERIHRIPGYDSSKRQLDEDAFDGWVRGVSELAKNSHFSSANDVAMGHILAYAPIGTDDVWPAECVRRLFERPHTEALENSFVSGRENQRGVYTATWGRDEDALADKYSAYAERLQLIYPRTAAIVRRISDNYRTQAKSERASELKEGY